MVIPRTSAFAFKEKNEDIRRIANILGVTHVLEARGLTRPLEVILRAFGSPQPTDAA